MTELVDRLAALGDELALGEGPLGDEVLARLDTEPSRGEGGGARWAWVAAVVVALAASSLAVPDARRAVADWLGIGSVSLERRPDLSVPATTTPLGGDDAVELDDGRTVLVTRIDARLDIGVGRKAVGTSTRVVETNVDGGYALWIDGEPHLLALVAPDGTVVEERVAGNTLLWQDGTTTVRLEGFDELADAVAYAESLD